MNRKKLRFILNAWVRDTDHRITLLENVIGEHFAKGSVFDGAVIQADDLRVSLRACLHTLDKLENPDADDHSNDPN